MSTKDFWDNIFSQSHYSQIKMPELENPVLKTALKHFGSVKDKSIIDLGCGRGNTSLFLHITMLCHKY